MSGDRRLEDTLRQLAAEDRQDPLPEGSFRWRRVLTLSLAATVLGQNVYALISLRALSAADELLRLALWQTGLLALVITYYMIAPSAEQLAHIVQAARIRIARIGPRPPDSPEATDGDEER